MPLSVEEMRNFIEKPFAFVERMGLKAEVLEPRYVRLRAPLAPNVNHIGGMYAGALFTLAEIPGGALYLTTFDITRYYPVVKEMTIRFRRPAQTDVTIEVAMSREDVQRITAEADEKGKAEFILEGEVKDMNGVVVAVSRGTYQIRTHGM